MKLFVVFSVSRIDAQLVNKFQRNARNCDIYQVIRYLSNIYFIVMITYLMRAKKEKTANHAWIDREQEAQREKTTRRLTQKRGVQ